MAALTAIHLCSGYGGFELALRNVARVRTVAHVERDAYAAAILVERMGQQRLDQAPIWDDVDTFDGEPWCGRVDIVTAGFPCQPFSAAGNKRGTDDHRWLWPQINRIIREVCPRYVILENVPNLVRRGLPHVLSDLAEDGFDAEWGLYSAADVGAPHRRQRIWVVAHTTGGEPGTLVGAGDGGDGGDDVDGSGGRSEPCRTVDVADTQDDRQPSSHCGGHAQAQPWPPHRDDRDGWADWIAEGGPQPVLRRLADGPPGGLADALHLGGNGLVPQCATAAIRQLTDRRGWWWR